jgi:hypothetical protein
LPKGPLLLNYNDALAHKKYALRVSADMRKNGDKEKACQQRKLAQL